MRKQALDKRERRFVVEVATGKSLTQAAKDAGYAKSTAEKKASAIFHRPLVQSALTRALEGAGITYKSIVQPIVEGLVATKSYVSWNGKMRQTDVPDHHQTDRVFKTLNCSVAFRKLQNRSPQLKGLICSSRCPKTSP